MSLVKQTLAGLMFSGLPHAPSGPICDRINSKGKKNQNLTQIKSLNRKACHSSFQENFS